MMAEKSLARQTVLITGATGNLGGKLRRHLEGRCRLRLLDIAPRGDANVIGADLSHWDAHWLPAFREVDVVVHLAADPIAAHDWPELVAPNLDALANAFLAAGQASVKRFVYASSNHVMGGYQDHPEAGVITTDLPPMPGTRYTADGLPRDSTPYAALKLCGERLGRSMADAYGMSVIAVRIGWVWKGENRPEDLPTERGEWFRQMWLSNRDFCRLMECCVVAKFDHPFTIINGMSRNAGMRWDMESARRLVGFEAEDDVGRS